MGYLVLACVLLIFPSNGFALQPRNPSETLVPRENRITALEARLALARILSRDTHTLDEALAEYRIILGREPDNRPVRLEMARVLIQKGDVKEALSIFGSLQSMHPDDPETLVALADLAASLGHAARSRDLYGDAVRMSDQPGKMKLDFADRMNMWGDFYRVESIYREHLRVHPGDRVVALKLAPCLKARSVMGKRKGSTTGCLPNPLNPGNSSCGLPG